MKKFLQNILALVVFTTTATQASAYDFEVDGIYYNILSDGKSAEVTYEDIAGDSYAGDIDIPEQITYKNVTYAVTIIGRFAFSDCSSLTSVVIPNSVTSISSYAFDHSGNLKRVDIPNSVTSIGECAFTDCINLTSIIIPSTVTLIGGYAFSGCSGLNEITSQNPIPPSAESVSCFEELYDKCVLYVPEKAIEVYKSTKPWNQFEKIVGIEVNDSHIDDVELADHGVAIKVVDGGIDVVNAPDMSRVIVCGVDGRVVTAMYAESAELHISIAPGIYLVKVGDTTAKVLVK